MVAESNACAVTPPAKPKSSGKKAIPLPTRLKAYNLYVIQQLGAQPVADACGLTLMQVRSLANREAWGTARLRSKERIVSRARAAQDAQLDEISSAAASMSDEGLLGALKRTVEATEATHEFAAKDAQAFSGAARNLMQIGRTIRGLDREQPGARGDGMSVNLFFLPAPVKAEQVAQPATEISAAPVA